jgi:parallel beta-helix repeat protein
MKTILKRYERPLIRQVSNGMLLLVFATIIFLTPGCKKDLAADPNDGLSPSAAIKNGVAAFGKPDYIVHKNGSIQAVVSAAKSGSLIQIEPGTYAEAITVTQQGIRLVGLTGPTGDGVIIQNPGNEETGITVQPGANGFSLVNVTIQNFTENGVFLSHVDGFYIGHVSIVNNGEYGLFPVFCSHGVIEFCTASGQADTGIYVGQSSDVVIRLNTVFDNVNGIEAENAHNIIITLNSAYNNTLGIFADLLPGKTITTASNVTITANIVKNNNHPNFSDPEDLAAVVPSGIGILVLGVDQVTVERNVVSGNNFTGITVFSTLVLGTLAGLPASAFADIEPNPNDVKVRSNFLANNGSAPPVLPIPLPGVDLLWDGSGQGNCWSSNVFKTSYPSSLPACN